MVAKQEEKQDLIRQAAIRAFSHKGFYNTRAEEIAREAGIAVGTIYNYFASKEEILLSIFKEEFEPPGLQNIPILAILELRSAVYLRPPTRRIPLLV